MLINARCFVLLLFAACTHELGVAPSGLGGTQWRFPDEGTTPGGLTVTFLADGTARFGPLPAGGPTGGHWKQDGNQLVFDSNDFTGYRVTIDGSHMTGEWKRLHGDDQRTHPTSLERVAVPSP